MTPSRLHRSLQHLSVTRTLSYAENNIRHDKRNYKPRKQYHHCKQCRNRQTVGKLGRQKLKSLHHKMIPEKARYQVEYRISEEDDPHKKISRCKRQTDADYYCRYKQKSGRAEGFTTAVTIIAGIRATTLIISKNTCTALVRRHL